MLHGGLCQDRTTTLVLTLPSHTRSPKMMLLPRAPWPSCPLPASQKIGLSHSNLAREHGAFKFCRMKGNRPQSFICLDNSFGIKALIAGQAICELLLIKTFYGSNLMQLREPFLLPEKHTLNLATCCLYGLKRTIKQICDHLISCSYKYESHEV